MYYYSSRTYDDWQIYIANGRKKYERTLYDRGYRIQYANKFNKSGDIQIVMPWINNHPLITIHPDNTRTLYSPATVTTHWGGTWSPLRAYSVRFTIYKYTGIEVVQRNYEFKLYEQDAKITPPKIQGCRMCKQSGRLDGYCHPSSCWNGDTNDQGVYSCPDHPDLPMNLPGHKRWHYLECEHGQLQGHDIPKARECHSCDGNGKRDYGSQRVSLAWDGSPIKVENGNIVKKPLTDLERIVAAYAGPTSKV
jgi:hypothetical protein